MAYPKVDFKGFEKEVASIRAILKRHGSAYAFKIKDAGFAFRGEIDSRMEDLVEDGKAELIGVYQKPLKSPDLVEDLIFAKGNDDANKRIHRGLS